MSSIVGIMSNLLDIDSESSELLLKNVVTRGCTPCFMKMKKKFEIIRKYILVEKIY